MSTNEEKFYAIRHALEMAKKKLAQADESKEDNSKSIVRDVAESCIEKGEKLLKEMSAE